MLEAANILGAEHRLKVADRTASELYASAPIQQLRNSLDDVSQAIRGQAGHEASQQALRDAAELQGVPYPDAREVLRQPPPAPPAAQRGLDEAHQRELGAARAQAQAAWQQVGDLQDRMRQRDAAVGNMQAMLGALNGRMEVLAQARERLIPPPPPPAQNVQIQHIHQHQQLNQQQINVNQHQQLLQYLQQNLHMGVAQVAPHVLRHVMARGRRPEPYAPDGPIGQVRPLRRRALEDAAAHAGPEAQLALGNIPGGLAALPAPPPPPQEGPPPPRPRPPLALPPAPRPALPAPQQPQPEPPFVFRGEPPAGPSGPRRQKKTRPPSPLPTLPMKRGPPNGGTREPKRYRATEEAHMARGPVRPGGSGVPARLALPDRPGAGGAASSSSTVVALRRAGFGEPHPPARRRLRRFADD